MTFIRDKQGCLIDILYRYIFCIEIYVIYILKRYIVRVTFIGDKQGCKIDIRKLFVHRQGRWVTRANESKTI